MQRLLEFPLDAWLTILLTTVVMGIVLGWSCIPPLVIIFFFVGVPALSCLVFILWYAAQRCRYANGTPGLILLPALHRALWPLSLLGFPFSFGYVLWDKKPSDARFLTAIQARVHAQHATTPTPLARAPTAARPQLSIRHTAACARCVTMIARAPSHCRALRSISSTSASSPSGHGRRKVCRSTTLAKIARALSWATCILETWPPSIVFFRFSFWWYATRYARSVPSCAVASPPMPAAKALSSSAVLAIACHRQLIKTHMM